MQMQLAAAEQRIRMLSEALDTVRREDSEAVRELRDGQSRLGNKTAEHVPKDWKLVSIKEFAGGKFAGAKTKAGISGLKWFRSIATPREPATSGLSRASSSTSTWQST